MVSGIGCLADKSGSRRGCGRKFLFPCVDHAAQFLVASESRKHGDWETHRAQEMHIAQEMHSAEKRINLLARAESIISFPCSNHRSLVETPWHSSRLWHRR